METRKPNQVKTKIYTNTPKIGSRDASGALPMALPEHKEYIEKTLSQIVDTPSTGSYLNLTSHSRKDMKPRAVIGKLILDHDLEFNPEMGDIQRVYFVIDRETEQTADELLTRTRLIHMFECDTETMTTFILGSAFV